MESPDNSRQDLNHEELIAASLLEQMEISRRESSSPEKSEQPKDPPISESYRKDYEGI